MTLEERLAQLTTPAFLAYLAAENDLTAANKSGDPNAIAAARSKAVLASRQAASELHQFADAVAVAKPPWLPASVRGARAVQAWVQAQHCRFLRGDPCEDMDLLHDLQDAIKHVELDPRRRLRPPQVIRDTATRVAGVGFGATAFGEGKFGGAEQVIITLVNGRSRALSSIFQNVLDAWRLALSQPLPPINE